MRVSPIDNVNELNDKLRGGEDCLIWFYAEWCGHCKSMEDVWEKLYQKNSNNYNMFKISDNKKDNVANNVGLRVQGFPTIMSVSNNKPLNIHKEDRTLGSLNSFLMNNVNPNNNNNNNNNNNVVECPEDEIDKLNTKISKGEDCLIWFFAEWCGHCQRMNDLWNRFYSKHHNTHNIFKISDIKKDEVANNISSSVKGYPTIMLVSNGTEKTQFKEERTLDNLNKFLNHNVKQTKGNSLENMLNKRMKSKKNNIHSMNSKNIAALLTPPKVNNVKSIQKKSKNNTINPINNNSLQRLIRNLTNNGQNNGQGENVINLTKLFKNVKNSPINLEEVNLNSNSKQNDINDINGSLKSLLNTIVKIKEEESKLKGLNNSRTYSKKKGKGRGSIKKRIPKRGSVRRGRGRGRGRGSKKRR